MDSLKKKNYKGAKCRICGVDVTTGSKTGACKKHNNKKRWSVEERRVMSENKKGSLNHRFGVKTSETTRRKLSEALKGTNSPRWRGGLSSLNKQVRDSLEYRLWREAIFERDNYTCVWCKIRGGRLNADHIKSFSLFPELRFAIDNGRTLCVPCHRTTDTFGGRTRPCN